MKEERSENSYRTFEDLECWKACRKVRIYAFNISKKFPKDEMYALTQDLRRAAYSTTQNIAEGYGRFHYQENIQFCRQSRGSLQEVLDEFITANDNEYITNAELLEARKIIADANALLNGYINYLEKQKAK